MVYFNEKHLKDLGYHLEVENFKGSDIVRIYPTEGKEILTHETVDKIYSEMKKSTGFSSERCENMLIPFLQRIEAECFFDVYKKNLPEED